MREFTAAEFNCKAKDGTFEVISEPNYLGTAWIKYPSRKSEQPVRVPAWTPDVMEAVHVSDERERCENCSSEWCFGYACKVEGLS
jgi:hypothetical protein